VAYSTRYRTFNRVTGRTDPVSLEHAGIGGDPAILGGTTGATDGISAVPVHCCQVRAGGSTYSASVCGIGAVRVDDAQCQTCCTNAEQDDANMSWENQCAPDDQLADVWCDEICCSEFDPSLVVSRFACSEAGGDEIPCELAPPN
jgi:hypothetical protein